MNLGYDTGLGYDLPEYDPGELETTFREVISDLEYDPEERSHVIYAEFALSARLAHARKARQRHQ